MNIKLFFQIILGAFGLISIVYATTEPNNTGAIVGIFGIILIAILLAITL